MAGTPLHFIGSAEKNCGRCEKSVDKSLTMLYNKCNKGSRCALLRNGTS